MRCINSDFNIASSAGAGWQTDELSVNLIFSTQQLRQLGDVRRDPEYYLAISMKGLSWWLWWTAPQSAGVRPSFPIGLRLARLIAAWL
jgi:hypothetical protein